MATIHWPSRLKASGIHLVLSLVVASLAAALVFGLWFPGYFAILAGGKGLFVLIASVDIVIGPLITLLIFERTKPRSELVKDLLVISALQLAALSYGVHTMYIARPAVMALEEDRFRVVPAKDVLVSELPEAIGEFRSLSLTGPRIVGTAPAARKGKEQSEEIGMAFKGYDLGARPKYWRDWEHIGRQQALRNAKPFQELVKRYPAQRAELDEALARTGLSSDQVRFLPIIPLHATAVALINGSTGDIVGYAPFEGF